MEFFYAFPLGPELAPNLEEWLISVIVLISVFFYIQSFDPDSGEVFAFKIEHLWG